MKMDTISMPVALVICERGQRRELRATLAYDRREPHEVRILFSPGREHLDRVLDRGLLAGGLTGHVTFGGVRAWPHPGDPSLLCIAWPAPEGDTRYQVRAELVRYFLHLTYHIVAEDEEPERSDIDEGIAAILSNGGDSR